MFSLVPIVGCACQLPFGLLRAYNTKIVKPDEIGKIAHRYFVTYEKEFHIEMH